MNPNTARILFAIFLLAHAWIHMGLAQVPVPQPGALHTPFLPAWWRNASDSTWPAMRLGMPAQVAQTTGWLMWLVVVVLYGIAALALLFLPLQAGLWQGFTAAASVLSLALLALFWHPWYPVGVLIDLALLAGIALHVPFLRFAH